MAGMMPCGNSPPFSVIMCRPGTAPPTGWPVARMALPTTRKATSAVTLISENQNSSSPKNFTASKFMPPTKASAMAANTHCGTAPKVPQYFM